MEGGAAQGVGLAVMEEVQLSDGRIRNASFTDYLVRIEDVLKADDSVANSDAFVLRMFGHLSDRDSVITPNLFTLPNPGDYLLFALGRNPDSTYGSGPEGLLDVGGEKVAYADGVLHDFEASLDTWIHGSYSLYIKCYTTL